MHRGGGVVLGVQGGRSGVGCTGGGVVLGVQGGRRVTSSSCASSLLSFPGSFSTIISFIKSMFLRTTSSSDSNFATCSGCRGPAGALGCLCRLDV